MGERGGVVQTGDADDESQRITETRRDQPTFTLRADIEHRTYGPEPDQQERTAGVVAGYRLQWLAAGHTHRLDRSFCCTDHLEVEEREQAGDPLGTVDHLEQFPIRHGVLPTSHRPRTNAMSQVVGRARLEADALICRRVCTAAARYPPR